MKMCDRCRVSGCLLNYNGKACKKARKEICPDVYYTNADHIRSMTDEELEAFLDEEKWVCHNHQFCDTCLKNDNGNCVPMEVWLKQPYKENA